MIDLRITQQSDRNLELGLNNTVVLGRAFCQPIQVSIAIADLYLTLSLGFYLNVRIAHAWQKG